MSTMLIAVTAVMWAAACDGQSVDSSPLPDADAQVADGSSIDSGASDSALESDAPNTCPPHQVACNGVCTDTRFDPSACGSCTNSCGPGEVCASGSCTSTCPSSQAACKDEDGGLRCADALTDNANCGYCGNVCGAGTICSNGKCSLTCGADETKCMAGDGTSFCTNLQNDPDDCNTCGSACPQSTNVASTFCSAGKCGVTCNAGALDCNANPVDGCEVSPTTDRDNCGVCGNICATGAYCSNSACTCGTGYNQTLESCNGACVDVSRDPTNCGGCGTRCAAATIYQSTDCVESACHYSNRAVITPSTVTSIAIDDTYLYYVQAGAGIRRVSKGSTAEAPVALIADTNAYGIAIDATTIYWTSTTGIFKCPLTGCVGSPKAVSDLPSGSSRIVLDDMNFYWTLTSGAGVDKCAKTGCDDAPVLLTNEYVTSMAIGPSSLFVAGNYYYDVYSITLTDPPTSSVLTTNANYQSGIAYAAGQVYWESSAGITSCDPTSCIPKPLAALPTGYYSSIPIAADDTAVVWAADGIHETIVATATDSVIGNIPSGAYQILLDATNVYWAAPDGVYWTSR